MGIERIDTMTDEEALKESFTRDELVDYMKKEFRRVIYVLGPATTDGRFMLDEYEKMNDDDWDRWVFDMWGGVKPECILKKFEGDS